MAATAAQLERGRARVECAGCGAQVSRNFLRKHRHTDQCKAGTLERELRSGGWRRTGSYALIVRIAKAAGVDIRIEQTSYRRGTYGKSSELRSETWLPIWFHALLGSDGEYELTKPFSTEDEAVQMFAPVIAGAVTDMEARAALEAAYAMSGVGALRDYAATPAFRAAKLRERARRLEEQARGLYAQAAAMDPEGASDGL